MNRRHLIAMCITLIALPPFLAYSQTIPLPSAAIEEATRAAPSQMIQFGITIAWLVFAWLVFKSSRGALENISDACHEHSSALTERMEKAMDRQNAQAEETAKVLTSCAVVMERAIRELERISRDRT